MKRKKRYVLECLGLRIGLDFPNFENKQIILNDFYERFVDYWSSFFVDYKFERVDWKLSWQTDDLLKWKLEGKTRWLKWLEEDGNIWRIESFCSIENINFLLGQLWIKLLWTNEGLVLHGSAVEKDGVAYVFVAESGVGKSTVAKILEEQGFQHLTDDVVFLRKIRDKWVLSGSPLIEKEYKPVKWQGDKFKIFLLSRGNDVTTRVVSEKKQLDLLLRQVFIDYKENFTIQRVISLIKSVSISELRVNIHYKDKIGRVIL